MAHSPTPSMVRKAASRNGDGKKAEAACDSWCSAKTTGPRYPSASATRSLTQSFWPIQGGMAWRKAGSPRGA